MAPDNQSTMNITLGILDLLANEASPNRLEELIAKTRDDGASATQRVELDQARQLALNVSSLLDRGRQREARLFALVDAAHELARPHDLNALLTVVGHRARLLLGLDMSLVSLLDLPGGSSDVRAADGQITACAVGMRASSNVGMGGVAIKRSAPFWTADYLTDDRFAHTEKSDEVVRAEGLRAAVAVPLLQDGRPFGTLFAAKRNIHNFRPDEISLIATLADIAMVAIGRAQLVGHLRTEVSTLRHDRARADADQATAWQVGTVYRELLNRVLAGCELATLVGDAAALLDGALLVRAPDGRELSAAGVMPDFDADELHRTLADPAHRTEPIALSSGHWAMSIRPTGEELGVLVCHTRHPLGDYWQPMLRATAQAVALLLLEQQRKVTAVAEGQVRDELFHDLLDSSARPPEHLTARAGKIGLDLTEPYAVVVVDAPDVARPKVTMWASSHSRRVRGLSGVHDDRVVLLLPDGDAGAAARAVSDRVTPLVEAPVTIGAAGPAVAPRSIRQTYQEAVRCLDALVGLGRIGATASSRELGFLGMLLSETPDVDGFLRSVVGPVLDYDAAHSTELVRTLAAYLDAGGSPAVAAENLHVHANTVSRRLERITELLGADWRKPSAALEIHVALRLQRIRQTLHQRHSDPRPAPPG